MEQNAPLKIGITIGDPAGIGPEIALKAVNSIRDSIQGNNFIPVILGRPDLLKKNYAGLIANFIQISPHELKGPLETGGKYICRLDYDSEIPAPGNGSPATGAESLFYIDTALDMWKNRSIDALVTAPVSKELIEKSGTKFTGHTEHIAASIGEENPLMLMFSEKYRVILVTTHIPVSRVAESVSLERILFVARNGYKSICAIDGKPGTIAVAGLDPHSGDGGSIGSFDTDVTSRAVEILRSEDIPAEGPFAADTLFLAQKWSRYSLAVAHYHDQGLIPFKMLAFDSGVNVTLGLSITRTSPDHGTAFDIAGKGTAGFSSMAEAVKLAVRLEQGRRSGER